MLAVPSCKALSYAGISKEFASHEVPVETAFDRGTTVAPSGISPSAQDKDICSAMSVLSLSDGPKSPHRDDGKGARGDEERDQWSLADIFTGLEKSSK